MEHCKYQKYVPQPFPQYDPGVKTYIRKIDVVQCKMCACILPQEGLYHNCPMDHSEMDARKMYIDYHIMQDFLHKIKVLGFKVNFI